MTMNDLDAALQDVFLERARAPEPPGLRHDIVAIPDSTHQASGWKSSTTAWRFRRMFSATRFIVAGASVALVAGVLVNGAAIAPSEDDQLAASLATPSLPAISTADPTDSTTPRDADASSLPCPPAWDPPDRSISWDTASARLQADSMEMRHGDCLFTGVGSMLRLVSDPGDTDSRTLEVKFDEQGALGGMYIYFGADETHWWVDGIASSAGLPITDPNAPASFANEDGQLFRTPRGETFEGDVRIPTLTETEAGPIRGELVITGLRLTAFAPGTGPVPLADCRHVPQPKRGTVRRQLDRAGITNVTPARAEALLRDRGLCFTFRYDYRFPPDSEEGGYTERWCTAPPRGRVGDFGFLPDGEVIVFVGDRTFRERREQPPEGWNCPSDAPAGALASSEPIESPSP